jgi:hypothetical protein
MGFWLTDGELKAAAPRRDFSPHESSGENYQVKLRPAVMLALLVGWPTS